MAFAALQKAVAMGPLLGTEPSAAKSTGEAAQAVDQMGGVALPPTPSYRSQSQASQRSHRERTPPAQLRTGRPTSLPKMEGVESGAAAAEEAT